MSPDNRKWKPEVEMVSAQGRTSAERKGMSENVVVPSAIGTIPVTVAKILLFPVYGCHFYFRLSDDVGHISVEHRRVCDH